MFVADYVLMEYGTGAIMAVPAHDERDFDFATKFGLEIRRVVEPADGEAPPEDEAFVAHVGRRAARQLGRARRPHPGRGQAADRRSASSREGRGEPAVNYRLRDWLLSRQRYWGCPIPVVHCPDCGIVAVPDDQLPVELPDVEDYRPKGQSPLAAADRLGRDDLPLLRRPGPPRDRHDGHLRRLLLVLPALPRPAQRRAPLRPRDRRPLDARRPVHRRRRARDPPPDVRALLRQGARRRRHARRAGALRQPLHPGDDHPRRGEDVEVEGQRRQPGRHTSSATAPTPPAPTSASWARPTAAATGSTRASRASTASSRGSGAWPPRSPSAARASSRTDDWQRRTSRAPRASSSPRRTGRSTRRPATSSAASSSTPSSPPSWSSSTRPTGSRTASTASPRASARVRFAASTAASLIFPFAPHLGSEVWERLEGGDVWEQPWPEADPELLVADRVTLVVQVNGKLRDRIEAAADAARGGAARARPRRARGSARTSTAARSSRRSSSPASSSTWSSAEAWTSRPAVTI